MYDISPTVVFKIICPQPFCRVVYTIEKTSSRGRVKVTESEDSSKCLSTRAYRSNLLP